MAGEAAGPNPSGSGSGNRTAAAGSGNTPGAFGNSGTAGVSLAIVSGPVSGIGRGWSRRGVAWAVGRALASSVTLMNTWPTVNLSPSLTRMDVILPETGEGIAATAFSFSSSKIGWSLATESPSLTIRLTTVPESAPSPRFGNLTSITLSIDMAQDAGNATRLQSFPQRNTNVWPARKNCA